MKCLFVISHCLSSLPKERESDDEHKQGKELAPRERSGQRGIRYPENFADYAHNRIEKKKATGCESIRFTESEADCEQANEK